MVKFVAKKCLWHICLGILVWLVVCAFSSWGRIYAGWMAGLMGACYLLAGWLSWLKSKGTDLMSLIRRKKPPEVPYYLRGVDKNIKPKIGIGGNRHKFDDEKPSEEDSDMDRNQLFRGRAFAWGIAGAFLLFLSAF